jgi:hypothetical protein
VAEFGLLIYYYGKCVTDLFKRTTSAMARAVRLHGELELRFGVRLSDDCHRSVAVWAKGAVKAHPRR